MNSICKVLFVFPIIIILGCESSKEDIQEISPKFDTLNMNIYSTKGDKIYSIESPYSIYDRASQVFNLKEAKIYLFKDNKAEYSIISEKSKLSNLNKTISLTGNVFVKNIITKDTFLNADKFNWNYSKSDYLLTGNVRFEDDKVILSSNKAVFNNESDVIEFFNPVKYIMKDKNNEDKYEINTENAYYNVKTKSINFKSSEKRVRSKFYF